MGKRRLWKARSEGDTEDGQRRSWTAVDSITGPLTEHSLQSRESAVRQWFWFGCSLELLGNLWKLLMLRPTPDELNHNLEDGGRHLPFLKLCR